MEITTCQELLDFLASSNGEAILANDIDFANYGQITSEIVTSVKKTIDLNSKSIYNVYPLLCVLYRVGSFGSGPYLTIKNGYIKNILASHGVLSVVSSNENYNFTINQLFTKDNSSYTSIKFVSVGFSLLGCYYYDYTNYNAALLSTESLKSGVYPAFVFDRCSFYIKSYNTPILSIYSIFKNCSLYYDVEVDSVSSAIDATENIYRAPRMFYFCIIKGKIKKSAKFSEIANARNNIWGDAINCYIDLETDIPNLFINSHGEELYSVYDELRRNPLTTDIATLPFAGDTVYNNDKYTATVEEGYNNQLAIGGQALTTAQMQDAEYLLQHGFLAIEEENV